MTNAQMRAFCRTILGAAVILAKTIMFATDRFGSKPPDLRDEYCENWKAVEHELPAEKESFISKLEHMIGL